MTTEPADLEELRGRAWAMAGRTLGELAAAQGVALPADLRRQKGLVGRVLEVALGAPGGSAAGPDFAELGVELKTLPIERGKPSESTYVCRVQLARLAEEDWEQSPAWRKLRHVLFVPVEATGPLSDRRIGTALEWRPSPAEDAQMAQDYEAVAELVERGELDRLTAHLGEILQVRPKAASGREVTLGPGGDAHQWTRPRGFYLRARFTASLLSRGRE